MSRIKGYSSKEDFSTAQKRNGGDDGIRFRFSRSVHGQKNPLPRSFYHLYEWDTIYEWDEIERGEKRRERATSLSSFRSWRVSFVPQFQTGFRAVSRATALESSCSSIPPSSSSTTSRTDPRRGSDLVAPARELPLVTLHTLPLTLRKIPRPFSRCCGGVSPPNRFFDSTERRKISSFRKQRNNDINFVEGEVFVNNKFFEEEERKIPSLPRFVHRLRSRGK